MSNATRKPAGFWTKDTVVKDLMTLYVQGKADLDSTTDAMCDYCAEIKVDQPREAIKADVVWYARDARKALGIASVRESKQIAQAHAELAQ